MRELSRRSRAGAVAVTSEGFGFRLVLDPELPFDAPHSAWRRVGNDACQPSEGDAVVVSPVMRVLYDKVGRAAQARLPVLVLGQTGSGKELVARALHEQGPRRERPFKTLNCGALPDTLLESQLFGHERGAFTGAERRTRGVFEAAEGGTLFLDEVGELSPSAQVALLRVLDTRCYSRIGSHEELLADVRFVAATHRNLEAMVQAGTFRSDLLYRLNAVTLVVPPLEERREEILPLALLFVARAREECGSHVTGIEDEARECLEAYSFPGNVRELRNAIEHALVVGDGPVLRRAHLPEALRRDARPRVSAAGPIADGGPVGGAALPLRGHLRRLEAEVITATLRTRGGSRKLAAEELGMPLRTFMRKLKELRVRS